MSDPSSSWRDLFLPASAGRPATVFSFRVLHKNAEPWLILPDSAPLAAAALTLYPAQRLVPRLLRRSLAGTLRARLPIPLRSVSIRVDGDDPFLMLLTRVSRCESTQSLRFAILAGNPTAIGRRFLLTVFGSDAKPVAAIKAGLDPAAWKLIEHEQSILASRTAVTCAMPQLQTTFRSETVRAFAMDYVNGDSPRASATKEVATLLTSWLDESQVVAINTMASWQRLSAVVNRTALWERLSGELAAREIHPALFHGDFAPWNIKVSDGAWTVLDWERGEQVGPPGWDWFHFVLQPAILVREQSAPRLAQTAERLLESPPFQRYAARARLESLTRPWLLAYLLYCIYGARQVKGPQVIHRLLEILARRWKLD